MEIPVRQLIVFRFGPEASFEGGLLGAAERIESGMSLRLLDALFVRRDSESGELEAISTGSGGASGVASAVLDFRLDPAARTATSERTLSEWPEVAELGDSLQPGEAIAALLVEHRWAQAFGEAVQRMGGDARHVDFVDAAALRDLMPKLREIR